jgi:hypothetical protein
MAAPTFVAVVAEAVAVHSIFVSSVESLAFEVPAADPEVDPEDVVAEQLLVNVVAVSINSSGSKV